ncbi:hypothetical protein FBU30_005235 [Linnemannia zychae]|nr:hypothetical protein FBU30_005235 [Linnemannia zychae]
MSNTTVDKADSSAPPNPLKGSDLPPLVTDEPPRVLIAGAGLAGLFLGILLEKAGIPYEIFERASEIKPLGSIVFLSPNILPAFEQLGLYDELMSFSKVSLRNKFLTGDLKLIGKNEENYSTEVFGYNRILFARPELYNLLLKHIPPHKIHLSKKVFSFQQNHEGVMIRFSDNTTAHGDILVGADGCHSAVRQHLYKTLDKQGLLPKNDTKEMNKGYISVVGTTDPLDPAKYPGLLAEDSETYFMIGNKKTPYSWVTFTVPGNKICWTVVIQVGISEIADDQFRSSDWVPQQNQKFLDSIRHFKTPYGTMGDLFDATPIERVSKVYFEDMLFETWNHGRTVLIGDGAGAVNAMQDAVLLANHIYDIKPTSFENIKTALKEYKEERFDNIKEQYPQSYMAARITFGYTLTERIIRKIVFNYLPNSIKEKQLRKDTAYRPQANFLPLAPKRGTLDIITQQPSKRAEKKNEVIEAKDSAVATL